MMMNWTRIATLSALTALTLTAAACASTVQNPATLTNAEVVQKVLNEGLAAGDAAVVTEWVRADYIQHSALAPDGRQGLLDFIASAPGLGVETHRVLSDGPLVATHTTYTFPDGTVMVGFDVFRVEGGLLVEHWDALQVKTSAPETASGHGMTDGPTAVGDARETAANRALVAEFVDVVLTQGKFDRITEFVSTEMYIQHNPGIADGLEALGAFVAGLAENGLAFGYTRSPLVVAEGAFVLVGSEGFFGPADVKPFAVFYDLFRVSEGKIVEHWDIIPSPAPDPNNLPHDNDLF